MITEVATWRMRRGFLRVRKPICLGLALVTALVVPVTAADRANHRRRPIGLPSLQI